MFHYLLVTMFALAGSLAVCKLVSAYSPDGEKAEPLSPISWVLCVLLFVGVNVGLFALGWPWIPVIILGLILAATVFASFNEAGAGVFASAAIPFAATAVLCFAKQADKHESPKTLWLVTIPVLALIAVFIIGKVKAMPAENRRKLKKKLTVGNIISVGLVIAAVIAVIILIKEVLLK